MQLLTKELRRKLPPLSHGEERGLEALALVKFFTPDSGWTWCASAFDGQDTFFGLVGDELDYFLLCELEFVRGRLGMPVERDLHYTPKTLGELLEQHRQKAVLQ